MEPNNLPQQWEGKVYCAPCNLTCNTGAIIFSRAGGRHQFVGGTRIFWGDQRGGPEFFQWVKGGDQNFLRVKEGGAKIFSQKIFRAFGAIPS